MFGCGLLGILLDCLILVHKVMRMLELAKLVVCYVVIGEIGWC